MTNFDNLPTEIILHVIENFRSARDVSNFSQLNHRTHQLVKKDGWRIFLQHTFPHTPVPVPVEYAGDNGPFLKDAAHSLTTLARNWDKKAIMARQNLPIVPARSIRFGLRSQTMGFTPALDSREEWRGDGWRDRHQILACGAGAQLYLQIVDLTNDLYPSARAANGPYFPRFAIYNEKGALDGRDDISAVKLLPQTRSGWQKIVVGRCSGDLAVITYEEEKNRFRRTMTLKDDDEHVRSIALNSHGILAVTTSGGTFAFHNVNEEVQERHLAQQMPLSHYSSMCSSNRLVWLNDQKLAAGSSSAPCPIEIFNAEGQSLRQFAPGPGKRGPADVVHSLAALSDSNTSNGQSGNSFLSGSLDGRVRRHDMRSPNACVATFEDYIDYSAVYSLLAYGQEKFVAGAAAGLLKVFDLRFSGTKSFRRSRLSQPDPVHTVNSRVDHRSTPKLGWSIFLKGQRWGTISPVYSLSKPSDVSPTLFAGTEGTVIQLDMNSTTDGFPDPVYGTMPDTGHRGHDTRSKWGSQKRLLQLSMYEHPKTMTESVKLRKQGPLGKETPNIWKWDERWM